MNAARQILHILVKDIRCHALEIGIVLVLNVVLVLTLTESWAEGVTIDFRDEMTDPATQLLLVLAWCALIGRVVQGDGVAGKAPYWLTRPYTRPALLSAKLAFVLLFVHLPLFLSQLAIVTGSGVPLSLPQMLADQAVLAACGSLPAMTLAALTTSFSRFVFACVGVAAVVMFVAAADSTRNALYGIWALPYAPGPQFGLATALVILAAIAVAALACQYRWRATLRVAASSVVALSLLGWVLLTLPTLFVMRVRTAVVNPATVETTIRFRERAEPRIVDPETTPDFRLVLLPIDVSDTGESTIYTYKVVVRSAAGREVELTGVRNAGTSYGAFIRGPIYGGDDGEGDGWLDLRMSPSDYDALKDELVTVRFIAEIEAYEFRETEPIPRDGSIVIVGGRAQCGVPARYPLTCRASSGWSAANVSIVRQDVLELWPRVQLRLEINPIVRVRISGAAVDEVSTPQIPTSVRERVSYTHQDVSFENVRLGDWGP